MRQDMTGKKFGRLLVLGEGPRVHKSPDTFWHCQCECGQSTITAGGRLRSGTTKSCGCIHGVPLDDPVKHEQLLTLLSYDKETGAFTYRRDAKKSKIGGRADRFDKNSGRRIVTLGCIEYYAHVLAYFYVYGEWPAKQVDHADRDPTNNKFDNLRLATHSQNVVNSKLRKNNTTGYRGVSRYRYQYKVMVADVYYGLFSTAEEAATVYDKKAVELFGEFARTNFEAA
jgi:HNH endonuclease